ncbi:MAG: hypothetical protein K9I94_05805 [Bacteroidales bacterium]|nr:hypothetical protein [Bacteroidales bacterium]
MWKIIKQLLIISLSLLLWENASSQEVKAVSSLSKDSILIGDPVTMEITVEAPAGYKVFWPGIGDTLTGKIEVLEKTPVDSSLSSGKNHKSYYRQLTITSYDSGYHAIPPVEFRYRQADDTTVNKVETDAQLLYVNIPQVDLAKDIKDIKDPMEAPVTFRELLPYIGGGLLLILIAVAVWYWLKKRKKHEEQPVFIKPKPKEPPHRTALNKLEELMNKKLWQSGKIKEYHTELTDILRRYIEDQFEVRAVEMTSDEILNAFRHRLAKETYKMLEDTLKTADLVKFAKYQPMPEDHERSVKNAYEFVRNTMPAAQPVYKEQSDEPSQETNNSDNRRITE